MPIALICEKCAKINSEEEGVTLIVDYRRKQISFFCLNKQCKHDNIFNMDSWTDTVKKSPLPLMRTV